MEPPLLSPHELATLLVTYRNPEAVDLRRQEFRTLRAHGLVRDDSGASQSSPVLTATGERLARVVHTHLRQSESRMPVSKRSTGSRPIPQPRHTKGLFLPLARADAEKVILRCRLALEAIRKGHADRVTVDLMASTLLLTRYLTEAGHGLLSLPFLDETEAMLFDAMDGYERAGAWAVSGPLIEHLVATINEHDRQLRETRLQAVIDASRRLDAYIERVKAARRAG